MNKELKIVFMGTPYFAVPILQSLIDNYNVRAVVTQPDRVVGRKKELSMPPIKELAYEHAILVLQPEKIRTDYEEIINLEPDLIITCAYGQIIPKAVLDCPRLGCINVHASLLPKLRGGAPIHHAIMEGYKETGITIMYMNEKMDEGDIIAQTKIPITDTDSLDTLYDKLSTLGASFLIEVLPSIINGTNSRIKQDSSLATYGFNIRREDERLDFSSNKYQLYNHIRGLNSIPGAYCLYKGEPFKVYESYVTNNIFNDKINGEVTAIYKDGIGVKVSNGEIVFTQVKLNGKTKMSAKDFINGNKDFKEGVFLE